VSIRSSGAQRGLLPLRADQLVAVQRSGFLGRLSTDRAAELVRSATLVRYPSGSVSAPKRYPVWAAIVVSGVVRQYLSTANGRQVTIRYARAGDLLGNSPACATPASVEIEAVETSDFLHLDVARLEQAARLEPEIASALVDELSSRLRQSHWMLARNPSTTVRSRVANDLIERAFEVGTPRPRAHVRVTQQALANATGSVREVVARALRELRLQGVIQSDPSGIRILDLDALIREAGRTS